MGSELRRGWFSTAPSPPGHPLSTPHPGFLPGAQPGHKRQTSATAPPRAQRLDPRTGRETSESPAAASPGTPASCRARPLLTSLMGYVLLYSESAILMSELWESTSGYTANRNASTLPRCDRERRLSPPGISNRTLVPES